MAEDNRAGNEPSILQAAEKTNSAQQNFDGLHVCAREEHPRRMPKKVVQQGRSERRGESNSVRYGDPLSEARTPLADFFSILLEIV